LVLGLCLGLFAEFAVLLELGFKSQPLINELVDLEINMERLGVHLVDGFLQLLYGIAHLLELGLDLFPPP
jgi:hypothetical protein